MNQPPYPQPPQQAGTPGCWWHPKRQTGLSCSRCGRPACPECLREASVGFQCIDCVSAGQRSQRTQRKQYQAAGFGARTIVGARPNERVIVTPILIALNVLVYFATAIQAKSLLDNSASKLFLDGYLFSPAIAQQGEWWRLITSGFLHFGPLHIAVNMFSLWMLGRDLERVMGRVRFTVAYLVAMLGGSISVFVFDDPGRQTAGASGAIYGLLGAILIAVLKMRLNPAQAIGVIVLNLIISVSLPNISLLGHLGGLVTGAVVMAAMVYAPKLHPVWQTVGVAIIVAALIGIFAIRDVRLNQQVCGVTANRQIVCVDNPGQLGGA